MNPNQIGATLKSETIMNFLSKLNSNRKKYTIELRRAGHNIYYYVYENGICKYTFYADESIDDLQLEYLFDSYANKNKVLN